MRQNLSIARRNQYENFAADSLQIAQTVKDRSIRDCACAGLAVVYFLGG
jgi:hypothetical protein